MNGLLNFSLNKNDVCAWQVAALDNAAAAIRYRAGGGDEYGAPDDPAVKPESVEERGGS